jgi:DNA invertase Pin-like site-specific DNA recombinase
MKRTTTNTTTFEPKAKFMHAIAQAMAEYAHDEQLRRMRAGREWRKRQGKR